MALTFTSGRVVGYPRRARAFLPRILVVRRTTFLTSITTSVIHTFTFSAPRKLVERTRETVTVAVTITASDHGNGANDVMMLKKKKVTQAELFLSVKSWISISNSIQMRQKSGSHCAIKKLSQSQLNRCLAVSIATIAQCEPTAIIHLINIWSLSRVR